jgi:hypothetical protein
MLRTFEITPVKDGEMRVFDERIDDGLEVEGHQSDVPSDNWTDTGWRIDSIRFSPEGYLPCVLRILIGENEFNLLSRLVRMWDTHMEELLYAKAEMDYNGEEAFVVLNYDVFVEESLHSAPVEVKREYFDDDDPDSAEWEFDTKKIIKEGGTLCEFVIELEGEKYVLKDDCKDTPLVRCMEKEYSIQKLKKFSCLDNDCLELVYQYYNDITVPCVFSGEDWLLEMFFDCYKNEVYLKKLSKYCILDKDCLNIVCDYYSEIDDDLHELLNHSAFV